MHTTIRTFRGDAHRAFDRSDGTDADAAIAALRSTEGLTWVDVLDPSEEEFAPLAEAAALDPLAVEDALSEKERPKALRYGDMLFVAAYTVTPDGTMSRLSIFLLQNAVLTVRLGNGFDVESVSEGISTNTDLLSFGPHALELMVLDAVVDGYTARVAVVDEEVEDLESILFDDHASNTVSQRTFQLHKDVGALRRVVLPMRDVVGSLLRRVSAEPRERELLPFAEDVYDHTMHAADWTDNLRDNVESVRSTNLALVDNQLNVVMKKLTSWAAIIAVPTAVTGYFGQNLPYPGFGKDWGFWMSAAIMIVLAVGLYTAFKKRDWL